MNWFQTTILPYFEKLKALLIYLTSGPPCKSWNFTTWSYVYLYRYYESLPFDNLEDWRQWFIDMCETWPKRSIVEKIEISDRFREKAHELVVNHLAKVYGGDGIWYGEECHWKNSPPLQAEWNIPNDKTLDVNSKVIFYIHGGAFVTMAYSEFRSYLESITLETGALAFGIDYRLAPEYPAPCQLEDVLAGILYLTSTIDEGGKGLNLNQIVVSGDSAGGGIASSICHFMRDIQLGQVAGSVLFSPWIDLASSHPSCEGSDYRDISSPMTNMVHSTGTPDDMPIGMFMGMYYASDDLVKKRLLERGHHLAPVKYLNTPIVSPLCDNCFRDLPPTLVIAGECERLRDESYLYHEQITSSYTEDELKRFKIPPSTTHIYEEMFHVFAPLLPEINTSKMATKRVINFINQCFALNTTLFEKIKDQCPINLNLSKQANNLETLDKEELKWNNLYFSRVNQKLESFKPNYKRSQIKTWSPKA
ncbi:alpha/beta-hydrolase [Conidiobolus coronatus NRRL 28638]|uniref:Alpha/beta-hydrolase n=1 Tax=Conidiobolus coronatus (strain ATCC 28846 / CBS 209.66 / NRRL 28638) TaxID=796925 RepID=A0A137NVR9_CONC2|nr:alpha/beta-hydrolase [Conidiobolus coronatus NRRL 28638]|eukprot:KXN66920.1 alpha/beta-hydrolase [Conidiobolus coronatus NRRL 28638]